MRASWANGHAAPTPTKRKRVDDDEEDARLRREAPLCLTCRIPKRWNTTISNKRGNAGRRFYQCDKCNDAFEWIDPAPGSDRTGSSSGINGAAGPSGASATFAHDPSPDLASRLRNASQEGNVAGVRACLAAPADEVEAIINETGSARHGSSTKATPLRFAAFHGYADVVRALLEAGALARLRADDGKGKDAVELAELGGPQNGAKGAAAERPTVLRMLRRARDGEQFVIEGVQRPAQLHLNGLRIEVVSVQQGKWHVRAPGFEQLYSLQPAKLRRVGAAATPPAHPPTPPRTPPQSATARAEAAAAVARAEAAAAAARAEAAAAMAAAARAEAAAAAGAATGILVEGSKAVITGLEASEYNGAAVEVVCYVADRQRYQVRFLASGPSWPAGEKIRVRRGKLVAL